MKTVELSLSEIILLRQLLSLIDKLERRELSTTDHMTLSGLEKKLQ